MQIKSRVLLLIFTVFGLWAGSLFWLGDAAHSFFSASNHEAQRALRDGQLIDDAMRAFARVESIRRTSTAMTEWLDHDATSAQFEALLETYWSKINRLGPHPGWRAFDYQTQHIINVSTAWERNLREALGFGDGRVVPVEFALDQHAAALGADLDQLRVLIFDTTALSTDRQRVEFWRLLSLTLAALGAVSLFAAVLTTAVGKRLANRFSALETAMRRMAAGDLQAGVIDADRNDEIGRMAAALEVFRRTRIEANALTEQNITVERRLIEERADAKFLQLSLEKEREINSLQRRFVAMVSHEFRTPLAIVDGTAQRVMRSPMPDGLEPKMARIRAAVKRLINLIESVLSVSTLDEGKITLKLGSCDLRLLLTEVAASQREINTTHAIALDLDALPPSIEADSGLLTQVFTNLLSNAAKYSPDGGDIAVAAASRHGWVGITVADSGVGIPADEVSLLFTRFFRARTSAGIAGSGIGLHLVRALVKLHGGMITVDSVEGEGSRFTVRLPISQSVAPEIEPDIEPACAEA